MPQDNTAIERQFSSGSKERPDGFTTGEQNDLVSFEGGRIGAVEAQIGDLEFKEDFSDPSVDVNHERHTADHEVVSGHSAIREQDIDFVVQALGTKPSELDITGWVTEDQLDLVDNLVSTAYVGVVTARWSGTAVVKDVDVPYSRTYHDQHGWIFEITIALVGVNKGSVPDTMQVDSRVKPTPEDVGLGLDVTDEQSEREADLQAARERATAALEDDEEEEDEVDDNEQDLDEIFKNYNSYGGL